MKIAISSLYCRTESTLSALFQSPTLEYIIKITPYSFCKGFLGGCYTRCYTLSCSSDGTLCKSVTLGY